MFNNNGNRVLNRMGARELTADETQQAAAAGTHLNTLLSTIFTGPASNPDEILDQ